jgi:predicted CXXCH cytochrome family protein
MDCFYYWFQLGQGGLRSLLLLLCCYTGVVLFAPQGLAFAAGIEIMTPQPGATIVARNPETHLVLRQAGADKSLDIRIKKSGAFIDPVVSIEGDAHGYWHFRLPLENGNNIFSIEPGGQRIELNFLPVQSDVGLKIALSKEASLFHRDENLPESCQDCHELAGGGTIAPVGLTEESSCVDCHKNLVDKGTWRHSTTVNQQCLACHQQSVKPWRIGFPKVSVRDYCLNCHAGKRSWLSKRFIHGPIVFGGCTLCHNPHSENHRYQVFEEGSLALCIVCHGDKENLVAEKKEERVQYVHGVIFGSGCIVCHDPHATDQQFMLKKPINELCSGCHPEVTLKSKGHPVANHPVAAPRELLRPGRKLTCASCHDPHGSNNQLMLIESLLGGRLCRGCHAKK